MTWSRALVLTVLVCGGCATGSSATSRRTFTGGEELYQLQLDGSFRRTSANRKSMDRMFEREDRAVFVGIIQEAQPLSLPELDEAVSINLDNAGFANARVVAVQDTRLSGIPARRSEINVNTQDVNVVMFNTHGATTTHSVQVMVWGPALLRLEMLELVEKLESADFTFRGAVEAYKLGPPYAADDVALFIPRARRPPQWRVTRRGELNDAAELELQEPEQGLYFMAFSQKDQDALRAAQDAVVKELAEHLRPGSLGNTEPRDARENALGVSWTQGGLVKSGVDITYRMRVLRAGPYSVRLYCWGASTNPRVTQGCDEILDAVDPSVPEPQAAPAP